MAAVKRTLFKFRLGGDDESTGGSDDESAEGDAWTDAVDPVPLSVDEEPEDDTPGRPYLWVGLGVGSLGGFAAAGYKLFQYRKSAKESVESDEPWRVDSEDESRLPDDRGTASLVGLLFVGGLAAVGKRLERDDWE